MNVDRDGRFDDYNLNDEYDDYEEESPSGRVQSQETDAERKAPSIMPAGDGNVGRLEIAETPAEIPRIMLQNEYSVHVIEIRQGTRAPEYSIYWNGHFAFATNDRNIEKQLAKNGVHKTVELTGDKPAELVNYATYLQRIYDAHLLTIQTGPNTTYSLFIGGKVIEAANLQQLQERVEAGSYTRVSANPPGKIRVTRLPDGKTSIQYPDASEVLLDKQRVPITFKNTDGNTFTRSAEGPPPQWTNGSSRWKGVFSFANGRVTFAFAEEPARDSIVFNGDGTCLERFRDKSTATYRGSDLVAYSDAKGTVSLANSGDSVKLTSADGKTVSQFTKSGNKWILGDNAALTADLVIMHQRLSEVYEKLGLGREALTSQRAVVVQLDICYVPGDTKLAAAHDRAAALAKAVEDARTATRHQNEAAEIRRVASYLEELHRAVDPVAYTASIVSRLPGELKIESKGQSVVLTSDSFVKLLQAIPAMRVGDAISVAGLRSVSIDGGTLKMEGSARLKFLNADGLEIELALNNTTAELKIDPADPSKLTLDNIRGVSAGIPPLMVNIQSLSIQLAEDADGNMSLRITPVLQPGPLADLAGRNIEPIQIPIGHKDDSPLPAVLQDIRQWIANPKDRDAGKLAEKIANVFMGRELAGLLRGIKSFEKKSDKITLNTTGGEAHSLGGLPIAWDKTVTAKLVNEGGRLALTDITGARFSMALPGDLAASLGLGGNLNIPVTEVSFSAPDAKGVRTATIKTNGAIESINVKVGPDMRPVPIDASGKISIDIVVKSDNQRLPMQVIFNPAQAGDPRNMDFQLKINGNAEAAPKAVEAFFGNKLDPVLRNALKGIESIEKRGDTITIKRSSVSTHELHGLTVRVGKDVSFKVGQGENMSLSQIQGIAITRLPGLADTIYRDRLPIILRSFALSGAAGNGERTMSIQSSGPLRSASIRLDAAMNPQNTIVVVENPVTAFKETLSNGTALRMMRLRTKGNDTYTISVNSNGDVDLGGLNNLADMFSNAGDLLSFEGAVITATGYIAQTIANPGNPVKAAEGLWGAVERTWNAIFP